MKAKKLTTNQEPKAKKYSVQDLSLERFMELTQTIKELTKELDELKSHFKHKGSHSTSNYVCHVETRTRTNPPSLKALVDEYGPEVKDLCTVSEFQMVKVSKKGGA